MMSRARCLHKRLILLLALLSFLLLLFFAHILPYRYALPALPFVAVFVRAFFITKMVKLHERLCPSPFPFPRSGGGLGEMAKSNFYIIKLLIFLL
jgi:hypothetical protein